MKERVRKRQTIRKTLRRLGFFTHVYRYKSEGYRRCRHCGQTEMYVAQAYGDESTGWLITGEATKPRQCFRSGTLSEAQDTASA